MFKETSNLKSKFSGCLDLLQRFKADVSGATGIEYALIASLVGVLGVSSAGFLGENLSGTFEKIGSALSGEDSGNSANQPIEPTISFATFDGG